MTKALKKIGGITSPDEKAEIVVRAVMPELKGAMADYPMMYAELRALWEKLAGQQQMKEEITYVSGDSIVHRSDMRPLSEEDVKHGLDRLIARNILRVGADVRCPHCGIRTWFHLDELRQFNECSGCGNPRPITAESEWSYRINSLVKRCVSAHVLAVLQALAMLAHGSMASFFYSPSLDLYLPDSDKVWHELDIACVRDGSLTLGDVKTASLINRNLLVLSRLLNSSAQTVPQSFFLSINLANGTTMARRMPFAVSCRWCSGRDSSIAVDLTHAHRAEAGSTHR